MMYKLAFLLSLFLLGLYINLNYSSRCIREGFENDGGNNHNCPNLLLQKGSTYILKNTKLADIPGVNPIKFDNLEEYTEFINWQRSQGINCPILYLQQSQDTQGNTVYKVRPDPKILKVVFHLNPDL